MADTHYKRVNILITEEQHEQVNDKGLNLSGLVRDLLHDRFSNTTITLSVSRKTRKLYDTIVSNFGIGDTELEKHLLKALDELLSERSKEIEQLKKEVKKGK